MAETKDFTCRACGAQFDSRDKLDQHNRREHGTQGQGAGGTGQTFGEGQPGKRGGTNEPRDRDKRGDESSAWGDEEG